MALAELAEKSADIDVLRHTNYGEYCYGAAGGDSQFDPEVSLRPDPAASEML
jgi:hypothetical protein